MATDKSHFVPYQIVNQLDAQRAGRPYSEETDRAIEKVLDSPFNTSDATAHWNRGQNKAHENELTHYAAGDVAWQDLSQGAKHRYEQQVNAYQDIRPELQDVAPGLTKEMDRFYNPGNKGGIAYRG
eukprot:TRINITY_DN97079_c0_g1_i1.p2 TRINITY_DN97079_c0_g1~~TRINITY_DN97079_c0_g1_i1.p2  ORF type:complete len:126 (+),score=24.23 TRINITY_DN97079_c0_g1_i1:146-523(+)